MNQIEYNDSLFRHWQAHLITITLIMYVLTFL